MHLLPVQSRSIDEQAPAVDLDLTPADVLLLSFTDTDLAVTATAWDVDRAVLPSLRLINLSRLKHPYSVDLFIDKLAARARFVLVRLLGGADYWRYGVDELAAAARRDRFELALLPGCHNDDPRLSAASTVSVERLAALRRYFEAGGSANARQMLRTVATCLGRDLPVEPPAPVTAAGLHPPACRAGDGPHALVLFYRSALLAADTAPIDALADTLAGRGARVSALFVTSLKDPETVAILTPWLDENRPDVILNTTAFSARDEHGGVLDRADAPVLQAALSGADRDGWRESPRGLGPADLAMNVVLPEVDGRLAAGTISFKASGTPRPELEFSRTAHCADASGIAHAADLALAWAALRRTPRAERRLACILPDYPGKAGRAGYAIGLDTAASVAVIVEFLREAGFDVEPTGNEASAVTRRRSPPPPLGGEGGSRRRRETDEGSALPGRVLRDPSSGASRHLLPLGEKGSATQRCCSAGSAKASGDQPHHVGPPGLMCVLSEADPQPILSAADYGRAFAALPPAFTETVTTAWGAPGDDPDCIDGAFRLRYVRAGKLIIAVQPDRGLASNRRAEFHDPALPPRHGYIAFYIWIRQAERCQALINLGAHGTLEWLPGKAVALGEDCAPRVLGGGTPVIYPFIVNNPGEAAQAKRRIGAVTIGHLTPPLVAAGTHGDTAALEQLFDEYAEAMALDPRRARLLGRTILDQARDRGLLPAGAERADPEAALAALDNWLCDIKEARIGDGLHVFGRSPGSYNDTQPGVPLVPEVDRVSQDPRPSSVIARSESDEATQAGATDLGCFAALAMTAERSSGGEPSGAAACGPAELDGLLRALDGRFVPPGPAGAPDRGRSDVLPTGRNLYSVDPRALPTRTAWAIGSRMAEDLVTRHAQDHGEWPRRLVLNLWGSATMRTGGDDLAQAFALIGTRPRWDHGSGRVCGFDILPLATLGRARVDTTLRISGLFRDAFPDQIALFGAAVRAVSELDEADGDNPLAEARRRNQTVSRVFGAAPGVYGLGVARRLTDDASADRASLGEAYLAATSHAFDTPNQPEPTTLFRDCVATAEAFSFTDDLPGQDALDSDTIAEHQGGFAAAASLLGGRPALYHTDTSRPETPRLRPLAEAITGALHSRATNPRWIAGQMRHGHRGAIALAETLDALYAYAATTDAVPSLHFDRYFDATLGDDAVRAFLERENPAAARAMAEKFEAAIACGHWTTRRNSIADILAAIHPDKSTRPALLPLGMSVRRDRLAPPSSPEGAGGSRETRETDERSTPPRKTLRNPSSAPSEALLPQGEKGCAPATSAHASPLREKAHSAPDMQAVEVEP